MLIHTLGLLCALVAAGFVAAAIWLRPEPTSIGLLIAVVAYHSFTHYGQMWSTHA
jgi:hypothetical protein